MILAWSPSPMRAIRSFVILILRVIVVVVSMRASPVVTMAVRATADRAVFVLRVVDDDLRGTACCCCC